MKRLTMLVTPEGEWVFPDSDDFHAALGDIDPDYDAVAFAVKNLGFVKFQLIEKSIIEIELHPRNVELPALLAVQQQLLTSQVRLFRIKYLDKDWHSEISSSVEHAIERLSAICAPDYAPVPSERFLVEPLNFGTLFDDESCIFRPLAQKWRVSFGQFDPHVISVAIKQGLLPSLMIVGVKPRNPDPVFRFIGEGHRWLAQNYQTNAIGEKIANQPDKEYGSWVSEFYKSIATNRQPRFDKITAVMRYDHEPGAPRRLTTYDRVLLPWKTNSDEVFITLCSKLVRRSDLTVDHAESSVAKKLVRSS